MTSSYYYAQMQQFLNEKSKAEEKKLKYESFVSKLESLNSSLSLTCDNLSDAQASFLNGGYNVGGQDLSAGLLGKNIENLFLCMSDLDSVISKTKKDIEEISQEIKIITDQYNNAKANYYAALRMEQAES